MLVHANRAPYSSDFVQLRWGASTQIDRGAQNVDLLSVMAWEWE